MCVRVHGKAGHTLVLGVGGAGKLGGGGGASFVAVIGEDGTHADPCSHTVAEQWRSNLTGGAALAAGMENDEGTSLAGDHTGAAVTMHPGRIGAAHHAWSYESQMLSSSMPTASLDGSFVTPLSSFEDQRWDEEHAVAMLLLCAGGGGGAGLRDGGKASLKTAGGVGLGQVLCYKTQNKNFEFDRHFKGLKWVRSTDIMLTKHLSFFTVRSGFGLCRCISEHELERRKGHVLLLSVL